jgi:hypothetical protein
MKKTKKQNTPTEHHPVVAGFVDTLKAAKIKRRQVLVDADVLDVLFVRLQELEIAASKAINTLEIAHKSPDTLRLKKFVRWSEREQKP